MSLSSYVQETNTLIERDMKKYKDLDKIKRERYRELENVDCKEMLTKANVQIKVMHQLLDRLIPSDDSHTVINCGKNYSIEVIP